jgi:hypothetical protein
MNKNKLLNKEEISNMRTKYTLKYNQELRNDWPEITVKEWERIETDEAFRDGFLLALNNPLIKINEIRK